MKTNSISITKTSFVYKKLAVNSVNRKKDINKAVGEILHYLTAGM
jgi:hypothetical protein